MLLKRSRKSIYQYSKRFFSDKFTLRKDIHKRIWYFESDTFSFGIGYTFTNGKTLEQIKSELTKGLETGKYNQDELNIL